VVYVSLPSSTRATSRRKTREPSVFTRSRMAPNCSGVCSRLCAMMVAFKSCPGIAGRSPNAPAATCAFWALMAATMSALEA